MSRLTLWLILIDLWKHFHEKWWINANSTSKLEKQSKKILYHHPHLLRECLFYKEIYNRSDQCKTWKLVLASPWRQWQCLQINNLAPQIRIDLLYKNIQSLLFISLCKGNVSRTSALMLSIVLIVSVLWQRKLIKKCGLSRDFLLSQCEKCVKQIFNTL